MQTGTATMENTVEIPLKTKNRTHGLLHLQVSASDLHATWSIIVNFGCE